MESGGEESWASPRRVIGGRPLATGIAEWTKGRSKKEEASG